MADKAKRKKALARADAIAARRKLTEDLLRPIDQGAREALSQAFVRGQESIVVTLEGMIYSSDDEEDLAARLTTQVARMRKHLDETS